MSSKSWTHNQCQRLITWISSPQGRNSSPIIRTQTRDIWNRLIDDYIAEGTDPRPRAAIERAAKINSGSGAYVGRTCDNAACGKVEQQTRFQTCSGCKIVSSSTSPERNYHYLQCTQSVYCSPSCQKAAWKAHKPICGSGDQREQALPSQKAWNEWINNKIENYFKI